MRNEPPASLFDAICDDIEEELLSAEHSLPWTAEDEFRTAVRIILSYGAFPAAGLLSRIGGCGPRLDGRQCRWRAEELQAAGYVKAHGSPHGRWIKPKDPKGISRNAR